MKLSELVICIFLTIILLLLFYGCSFEKKLERKQEDALNTVLASRPLLDKACKDYLDLFSNPNDSASGLSFLLDDSYSYPVLVPDSNSYKHAVDSMQKVFEYSKAGTRERTDCNTEIKTAYSKGFSDAVNSYTKIKLPPTIDTTRLTGYISNLLAINRMLRSQSEISNDSINHLNSSLLFYRTSENELGYNVKNSFRVLLHEWWFWVIIILSMAFFVFKAKVSSFYNSLKAKK